MIDKDEFLKKYLEVKSIRALAKHYQLPLATARYWIKKWEIPVLKQYNYHHFKKEDLQEQYDKLGTIIAVANYYNVSASSMIAQFKKYHIPHSIRPTKNSFNEKIFQQENPISFYLAGFIAADGNVDKKSNRITIGLAEKDKLFLEKIKTLFNFKGELHQTINYGSKRQAHYLDNIAYLLRLSSATTKKDLEKFNIVPAKSKILKFPDWIIDHPLASHFLRGYFDGDGCLRIDQENQLTWKINGTKDFLIIYQHILEKNCQIHHNQLSKDDNIYCLKYCGNGIVPKICQFLYHNSVFHLDRKYKIYQNWMLNK